MMDAASLESDSGDFWDRSFFADALDLRYNW